MSEFVLKPEKKVWRVRRSFFGFLSVFSGSSKLFKGIPRVDLENTGFCGFGCWVFVVFRSSFE